MFAVAFFEEQEGEHVRHPDVEMAQVPATGDAFVLDGDEGPVFFRARTVTWDLRTESEVDAVVLGGRIDPSQMVPFA